MIKSRLISYLSYILIIFMVGLFYNITSPDFAENYDGIYHLSYTLFSSFVIILILLATDSIIGNFSRGQYCFKKDKIGFFVLFVIVIVTYFIFPNVKSESVITWLIVILLGETLRHLFLFYKLKHGRNGPDRGEV